MASVFRFYTRCLANHPTKTVATTTGTLMGTGDIISQFIIEKRTRDAYEPKRTARFFIFGVCAVGPILRGWYLTIDKIVPAGTSYIGIKKMLVDQTLFAPVFLTFFLSSMSLWKTGSIEEVKATLKRDYTTVLMNNYKLWPAAQAINFTFIPIAHRVLFANSVALFWNTYLSYKANR